MLHLLSNYRYCQTKIVYMCIYIYLLEKKKQYILFFLWISFVIHWLCASSLILIIMQTFPLKWKVMVSHMVWFAHAQSLSHIQLFVTLWTVAHQPPLTMGFPREEYWNGLSFSSPGDLPNPGIEPKPPALASGFFTTEPPEKPYILWYGALNYVSQTVLKVQVLQLLF